MQINSKDQIINYFLSGAKKNFFIGVENEKFLFQEKNNVRATYSDIKKVFEIFKKKFKWKEVKENENIVGLKTGGKSILANAASLYLWLKEFYPKSIPILSKDIIRDVITPGSKIDIEAIKKNQFPIFSCQAGLFKFRYMRYWIISGHEKCNKIAPKELIKGLDHIDKFFEGKERQINYNMERGDMLYINNNFICHNRTEYTDYKDLERKRTLVRTWINL